MQECILLVTQRITKYPVLVERIIQNTEGAPPLLPCPWCWGTVCLPALGSRLDSAPRICPCFTGYQLSVAIMSQLHHANPPCVGRWGFQQRKMGTESRLPAVTPAPGTGIWGVDE